MITGRNLCSGYVLLDGRLFERTHVGFVNTPDARVVLFVIIIEQKYVIAQQTENSKYVYTIAFLRYYILRHWYRVV